MSDYVTGGIIIYGALWLFDKVDFVTGGIIIYGALWLFDEVDFITGGIIIYGALWLFDEDFVHVVSITFTALILTELLMVALTIRTWHWAMVVAEVFSLALYIASLLVLRNYFGK